MAGKEAFSVCMCVYHGDNPEWFDQALNSVLNQTVPPDEVVLVVDGPIGDKLEEVLQKHECNPLLRIVRLKENRGHGEARRTGLDNCTYPLVALMDADDISLPDRFERQLGEFAEDPDLSIVGGRISEFIHSPDNVVGIREVTCTDAQIKEDLQVRCPFNQVTVMVKKSDVDKAGGYQDWFSNEDYYLWIRMFLAGMKFANVPEVLVNVRVGEDMYRRRGGWKYFRSELGLQNYMLSHNVIGFGTYAVNVAKRLIVQVLLPNRIRGWVFQKFARTQKETAT